jgi:hypothetical protein
MRMKVTEIYLQPERYNARIKATVPGAWMAVYENGYEFPVCPDYKASSEAQARQILNASEAS